VDLTLAGLERKGQPSAQPFRLKYECPAAFRIPPRSSAIPCFQLGITIGGRNARDLGAQVPVVLTMPGIILGSQPRPMSALVSGMEKGAKESLIAIGGLQKVG